MTMINDRALAGIALVARIALCSAFLISAVTKTLDFQGAVGEVGGLTGLEPAPVFAVLVILTQFGGSVLLILGGRAAWAGAALLGGFTLVATVIAHDFWTKTGVEATRDLTTFFEHMGLIGGFVLAALLGNAGRAGDAHGRRF